MLQDGNNLDQESSGTHAGASHQGSDPARGGRNQVELEGVTHESAPPQPVPDENYDPRHLVKGVELIDNLAAQKWHKPYGQALLEANFAKRVALIAEAEQAIGARYIELSVATVPTDENLDLQHAVEALSRLKKTDA
ncbi:MAG: hypothetical protein NVS9B13_05350 [Candidatus Acidiferrum sp.]